MLPSSSYKTPLRYPGGKSRAMRYLLERMPETITDFRDPFVGGGSVFLAVKKKYPDVNYWINDAYGNLYNFWIYLRDNSEQLVESLDKIKRQNMETMSKKDISFYVESNGLEGKQKSAFVKSHTTSASQLFLRSKELIESGTDLEKATSFYILNKCSFSGLTEQGTFSAQASIQNFTLNGIEKLLDTSKNLQGVRITNDDYSKCFVDVSRDTFIFLDPPYDIGRQNVLYGKNGEMHSTFDHDRFAKNCKDIKCKFMVTYNNCEKNTERFSDYICNPWSLKYGMRIVKNKDGERKAKEHENNELLVTNYDTGVSKGDKDEKA